MTTTQKPLKQPYRDQWASFVPAAITTSLGGAVIGGSLENITGAIIGGLFGAFIALCSELRIPADPATKN